MAKTAEEIQQMARNAQGIPANPEVAALRARDMAPESAPPAVPPGQEPATAEDTGLDSSAVDFFGNLAAEMDSETQSIPEPTIQTEQPHRAQAPVEELPYEPPVHQRLPGEAPESLEQRPEEETQPLEAAIEQPLVEEEIRLTAEEWAAQQRQQAPQPPPEQPSPQQQFDPAKLEEQAISNLMATEYALSDDDKNALIAEPDTVIPRLAARMHVRMQVQLAQQIAQILPGIVDNMIQQQGKVQKLEDQFFGKYPSLNKPEYRQTVQESLQMIRSVNPKANREQVMRDGAALAAVRLRQNLGESRQETPRPPAPGNMPLGNPAPQPQAPFTPAQAGGVSEPVVPTNPNQDNIFSILAGDDDW